MAGRWSNVRVRSRSCRRRNYTRERASSGTEVERVRCAPDFLRLVLRKRPVVQCQNLPYFARPLNVPDVTKLPHIGTIGRRDETGSNPIGYPRVPAMKLTA